jgi:hypothetical protein
MLAKGSIALEGTETDDEHDSIEHTYDPLWLNARRLMDYLAEREMIVHELAKARIGQFALIRGKLAVFDLAMFREGWKQPAIRKAMLQEVGKNSEQQAQGDNTLSRNQREQAKRDHRAKQEQEQPAMDAGLELLKLMPHAIQASLKTDDWSVWSSLREAGLVNSAADLFLKHGVAIAGEWTMLGILDALPHDDIESAPNRMLDFFLEQRLAALSLGVIAGQALPSLAPMGQMLLGRPAQSYGMTPLLIFREVSG